MPAYAIVRPQVAAGKVKVLAITNRQRFSALQDIPTAKEAGYPSLDFDGLVGIFAAPEVGADIREQDRERCARDRERSENPGPHDCDRPDRQPRRRQGIRAIDRGAEGAS